MAGRYLLKQSGYRYYFELQTADYEILFTSELYTSLHKLEMAIATARADTPVDARYSRLTAWDGDSYFELKAANGKAIGRSEKYPSSSARDGGIEAAKTIGPTAPLVNGS